MTRATFYTHDEQTGASKFGTSGGAYALSPFPHWFEEAVLRAADRNAPQRYARSNLQVDGRTIYSRGRRIQRKKEAPSTPGPDTEFYMRAVANKLGQDDDHTSRMQLLCQLFGGVEALEDYLAAMPDTTSDSDAMNGRGLKESTSALPTWFPSLNHEQLSDEEARTAADELFKTYIDTSYCTK